MSTLSLALYCEGPTDQRFFSILIQRISQQILARRERPFVEVLPVDVIKAKAPRHDEAILQAANQAAGYHALIVHADADHPTREKALQERFHPGYELVQRSTKKVCKNLLPVIPVYMTEAWMLADYKTLQAMLETRMSPQELGLPRRTKLIESDPDPKWTLNQLVKKAYPKQSRNWNKIVEKLYDELALFINLERLEALTAYKEFVKDMTQILMALNLIQRI